RSPPRTPTRTPIVPRDLACMASADSLRGSVGHCTSATRRLLGRVQPHRRGIPGEEEIVGGVVGLALIAVAEALEEGLEAGHVLRRHFEPGEHPAEVGAVIAVVEQADVPAAA